MTTVVFVHGTGGRKAQISKTVENIKKHLQSRNNQLNVEPCYWGDACGAKLPEPCQSIPPPHDQLDQTEQSALDKEMATWSKLYEDPLFELRLYAACSRSQNTPSSEFKDREQNRCFIIMRNTGMTDGLKDILRQADIWSEAEAADRFKSAVWQVDLELYNDVRTLIPHTYGKRDVYFVISRAIVASMLVSDDDRERQVQTIDVTLQKKMVDQLTKDFQVSDIQGMGINLLNFILAGIAAKLRREDLVYRKRKALTNEFNPYAADIMLYQARGEPIRQKIKSCIQSQQTPVILLAHSLGGIACVDLLIEEDPLVKENLLSRVKGLITVGTQVPFLYEIDALNSLRPPLPLPNYFPRWLNVYDPNDWLSYKAREVFHNNEVISDFKVKSDYFFPQSHSAYWEKPGMWDEIIRWINAGTVTA